MSTIPRFREEFARFLDSRRDSFEAPRRASGDVVRKGPHFKLGDVAGYLIDQGLARHGDGPGWELWIDVEERTAGLFMAYLAATLGTAEQSARADGFTAVFAGPQQRVALIEAGATAASKWWATGLGASVIAVWGSVAGWWPKQETSVQVAVLAGAAAVTVALVLSIAYVIALDVRGRAAAAVSMIEARATARNVNGGSCSNRLRANVRGRAP